MSGAAVAGHDPRPLVHRGADLDAERRRDRFVRQFYALATWSAPKPVIVSAATAEELEEQLSWLGLAAA